MNKLSLFFILIVVIGFVYAVSQLAVAVQPVIKALGA